MLTNIKEIAVTSNKRDLIFQEEEVKQEGAHNFQVVNLQQTN